MSLSASPLSSPTVSPVIMGVPSAQHHAVWPPHPLSSLPRLLSTLASVFLLLLGSLNPSICAFDRLLLSNGRSKKFGISVSAPYIVVCHVEIQKFGNPKTWNPKVLKSKNLKSKNLKSINFLSQVEVYVLTWNAEVPRPWGPTIARKAEIKDPLGFSSFNAFSFKSPDSTLPCSPPASWLINELPFILIQGQKGGWSFPLNSKMHCMCSYMVLTLLICLNLILALPCICLLWNFSVCSSLVSTDLGVCVCVCVCVCVFDETIPGDTVLKNPPANAGDKRDTGLLSGSGRSSGGGNGNTSSILTWRITWAEEPGRLRPWGCKDQTRLSACTHLFGCLGSWLWLAGSFWPSLMHVGSVAVVCEPLDAAVGSSSLARVQTQAPCTGNLESYPLEHQCTLSR